MCLLYNLKIFFQNYIFGILIFCDFNIWDYGVWESTFWDYNLLPFLSVPGLNEMCIHLHPQRMLRSCHHISLLAPSCLDSCPLPVCNPWVATGLSTQLHLPYTSSRWRKGRQLKPSSFPLSGTSQVTCFDEKRGVFPGNQHPCPTQTLQGSSTCFSRRKYLFNSSSNICFSILSCVILEIFIFLMS